MNELGMAKLKGVMRRRRIPILVAMVGVLGVSAALISLLEPGYKASAVIRAAEVQPAKEYVAPTVAEQLGERLKSLRLSVMARPIVAEAAKDLDLYRQHPKLDAETVVESIRSRMDVKLEGDDTYLLTYSDSSPERAKAVVNKVAELFMKRQVEQRQRIATATTQALRGEVNALKPELDAAEKGVRDYKLAHYGSLPEQQEGNLRTLDQTTMELNIQSTNLDLDQERRRTILTLALSPLRHHEETLAAQLYESRTKYTEDNPEVARIQASYDKIKANRIAEEKDLMSKTRRSNPELMALEGEIARTKSILQGLRDRQSQVRKRVEDTAKNGQSLGALTTVYDGLKDKYSATLGRLRDAELAERLESGLASLRFELVEGASMPSGAASPNRPLLAVGALVLAVVLGLGLGFALDTADTSLRDPDQLRGYAPTIPVLASIPHTSFHISTNNRPKAEA
jgi:succinoglycan biosynthesis transport protein ExoP